MQGRKRSQRGYADGLVPLITLMFYGLIGIVALAVLASLALPLAVLRGRWRIGVVLVVIVVWGWLYQDKIRGPNLAYKADTAWRTAVWQQCNQQLGALSGWVIDGFVDEGAALRKRALMQIFAERRLSHLEIKVRVSRQGVPSIAYPDGDQESGWELPGFQAPYARLELGRSGHADCAILPLPLDRAIQGMPFLPDTCIRLTPLAEPTSPVALTLVPADLIAHRAGSWSLRNRSTGQVLATLPTTDTADGISADLDLSSAERPPLADCRSPHTVLADRLFGTALTEPQRQHPQVLATLATRVVNAAVDVKALPRSSEDDAGLPVTVVTTRLSEQEQRHRFNPDSYPSAWSEAIESARSRGIGNFGRRLVNWADRTVVTLRVAGGRDHYPWSAFAVDDGFILLPTSPGWYGKSSRLLVRLGPDGTHQWSVSLARPATDSTACAHFEPSAVYIEAGFLVLAARCGELWKVPLEALPDQGRNAGFFGWPPTAAAKGRHTLRH